MQTLRKFSPFRGVLALILTLALSACGGGGGGGGGGGNRGNDGPGNSPPVISPASFTTKEGAEVSEQVTATDTDNDPVTFVVTANPTNGTLVSFSAAGAFVYQPTPGFTGDDSFRVSATDTANNVATAMVSINVHPNSPPIVANDVVRADGVALASVPVLNNDSDADGDPLVVTIEEPPFVGTATVNPDSTINIGGLPSGFKGVTRFRYRVTDSSDAMAIATAVVFVGTDPFRVVFAGDEAGSGSNEVFVSDFTGDATALTNATEGTMRLRGFVVSQDGSVVVYRREDQAAPATMDLAFVRTDSPLEKTIITLPAGATLPLDANDKDQFVVSPDGQWIALIARVGGVDTVCVTNVSTAASVIRVSPADTMFASGLRFSRDSKSLYLLASSIAGGGGRTLYTVTVDGPSATVPVSAISDTGTNDDVADYEFSADQTGFLLLATRLGRRALYFVDARQLQTETQISHKPGIGESIGDSTLSLPGGTVGGTLGQHVGYTLRGLAGSSRAYIADISAMPNNGQLVATNAEVVGLRPDDNALLYSKSGQIHEHDLASGADAVIAAGGTAWYDSTGNIVLVQQAQFSGLTPYPVLGVTTRVAFNTVDSLGTPGQAARLIEVSGFDRGVVLLAEGPPASPAPAHARLALVNGLAPDKLLYLGDFDSPLQLTSPTARVIGN